MKGSNFKTCKLNISIYLYINHMKTIPTLFTEITLVFVPTSICLHYLTPLIIVWLQGFAIKPSKIDVVERN